MILVGSLLNCHFQSCAGFIHVVMDRVTDCESRPRNTSSAHLLAVEFDDLVSEFGVLWVLAVLESADFSRSNSRRAMFVPFAKCSIGRKEKKEWIDPDLESMAYYGQSKGVYGILQAP